MSKFRKVMYTIAALLVIVALFRSNAFLLLVVAVLFLTFL